jgi:tripartite-type tricarboxylate transporter receptor subunit TctC
MKRLWCALALAAMMASLGVASNAIAQVYPSRPITMIVPLPPGGAVDVLARILVEPMRASLGQPVVIENVSGAGGSIGVGRVVHAAPDGYTIGIGNIANYVMSGAVYTLQFDLLKDLSPIALLPSVPAWIVARKTLPATDLQGLIGWLKANPDRTFGIIAKASPGHLCGIELSNHTGSRFQFVPYRGGAPMLQDLVAGQIDFSCDLAANSLAQVRGGNIKAIAVMAPNRWFAAPEVPTADEQGLRGIYGSYWHGFWAPRNTPKAIVARLNAAAMKAMADPAAQKRIAVEGMEIPPPEQQTPEMLGAFQKAEIEKWWPIIKAAGIEPE